ncbi:MAG: symmetrical bis(5'-nucleosyl)-tetraphosphatase [Proteobacteria bacterium]|nr:symmetrical bis(5'-nucleosyl)-tetraphosphatase [Pseudomonadota bacterium]HQR03919.1 symmetrical bis(5'-nucleosyl)-tetraphosphatase [Rhodocyclaceae bacterium]
MATYAIGDLQGCFDPLQELLEMVDFDPARDRLWFVGDLVNRGPQSLEVLRFVHALGDRAVVVLGNHDLHLVMQAEGYGRSNRDDTLQPVLDAPDRELLLAWLRSRPLFYREGEFAMVHAGLLPQWTADRAQALSDEVSAALQDSRFRDFLARMWGSQPAAWSDALSGWDRLRVIVNAMTRMRYCDRDGAMDFRFKGPPAEAPAGCLPWFDVPGRASTGITLICGHWSALGLRLQGGLLALDTGCLWGGSLTAVRLEDRSLFQLPCPRQVAPSGWD